MGRFELYVGELCDKNPLLFCRDRIVMITANTRLHKNYNQPLLYFIYHHTKVTDGGPGTGDGESTMRVQ